MAMATNPSPTWPQREAAAIIATLTVVVLAVALVMDREEVMAAGALKVGHPRVSLPVVWQEATRSFGATKDSTLRSPGCHRRLLPLQQPPMALTPTGTYGLRCHRPHHQQAREANDA